jgi:ribose transport system permease protein
MPSRITMELSETANRKSDGQHFYVISVLTFLTRYYIQSLLAVSVVILAAVNPYFRTVANLENILLQASFAGIGAAGMTLLIVSGAFDLSVAGLLGLCGVLISELLPSLGVALTVVAALFLGVLLGLLNGLVVTKLRIPAFIATLGMMNIYLALAFIWTQGSRVISVSDPSFNILGTGTLFGILPIPFLMMIVTYLVCHAILSRSVYGRCLRAVGSSEIAARTAGLPVDFIRILAFAIVGGCSGLAGVFLTAELSSASAIMATGYELTVIAVVVIGGTSLKGGEGTLFGSFAGALFFAVISSALNILNVGAYWQYVVTGIFLISALGVQALRSHITIE